MNRRKFLGSSFAALSVASLGGPLTFAQSSGEAPSSDVMAGDDPMAAAVYLSHLEASPHMPMLYELYGYIHPDAAEVVGRGTVIGWYQEEFQPLGPELAVATDVQMLDSWTWEVTGQSYSNVAEVSYTQEFANGDVVNDVVRLVFHEGSWRWWFGRDQSFIDEQYARFSQIQNTETGRLTPSPLDNVTEITAATLDLLPAEIIDDASGRAFVKETTDVVPSLDSLSPEVAVAYTPTKEPMEFDLGWVTFGKVVATEGDADALMKVASEAENLPPVVFQGWDPEPNTGPAWLLTENAVGEAHGTLWKLYLVQEGNYLEFTFSSVESLWAAANAIAPTTA